MCQSHTVRKEESDEWFLSLQYLNASINNLSISKSILDNGSEFGALNNAAINAFRWKADNIKDKDGKTVTATGNFTHIDNGEPESMLCLDINKMSQIHTLSDIGE
ncbi:8342_t:CDS:2, partial [Diversispora eburnea]